MNNFAKIQLNLLGVMLVVTYANAGILSLREHKIKYDFQKQEEVINLASLNASYDFLLIENQLLNKKLQYTQKVLRNERKKGLYYHLNLNLMPFKTITDEAVYLSAFNQTLKHEGGLGIDNNGYAVNYGINQKWYRPFKGMPKTVNNLNKQFASKYYYFKYFKPLNLNANYSQVYINFIFDTAVNKSVRVANSINKQANGNLEIAKELRLKHLKAWYSKGNTGSCKKACYKALIKRVNSFKEV